MNYKTWLTEVFKHINTPPMDKINPQDITDFPTVDFKHLHKANLQPETAAGIAKSIRWYSLPVEQIKYTVHSKKSKGVV